jgi:hypothetical protein
VVVMTDPARMEREVEVVEQLAPADQIREAGRAPC